MTRMTIIPWYGRVIDFFYVNQKVQNSPVCPKQICLEKFDNDDFFYYHSFCRCFSTPASLVMTEGLLYWGAQTTHLPLGAVALQNLVLTLCSSYLYVAYT